MSRRNDMTAEPERQAPFAHLKVRDKARERLPLLLSQARFRHEQGAGEAAQTCLRQAESCLASVSRFPRWPTKSDQALEIAKQWLALCGSAAEAYRCLETFLPPATSVDACLAFAFALQKASGIAFAKQIRRHLSIAEEFAETSRHWCRCADMWQSTASDKDHAWRCLVHAAERACTTAEHLDCARLWAVLDPFNANKQKDCAQKANDAARTSYDWLQVAYTWRHLDAIDAQERSRDCLARAESAAKTHGEFLEVAEDTLTFHSPEMAEVGWRCFRRAKTLAQTARDWMIHILAVLRLCACGQQDPFHPELAQPMRRYYQECLARLTALNPTSHDWSLFAINIPLSEALNLRTEFILRAEAKAQTSADWLECALAWEFAKTPEWRKNAAICRLRALSGTGNRFRKAPSVTRSTS